MSGPPDATSEDPGSACEKIEETGVRYIYYQYISITGRIMGKAVPSPALGIHGRQGNPDVVRRPRPMFFPTARETSSDFPPMPTNW